MDNHRYLQLLGSVSPSDMLVMCLDMMEGAGQFIANTGMLAEYITLAIDEHLIPRHDKNKKENSDLKGGRRKRGTNYFEGYVADQIVSGKPNPTLAAYPIATGESQSHYVGGLIENVQRLGVKVGAVLMDRGFNSVAVLQDIVQHDMQFIMPMKGSEKLYEILKEVDEGTHKPVTEYTMNGENKQSVTHTLVVVRKKRGKKKSKKVQDKYIAFLTNVELKTVDELLEHIPEVYRGLWGIETGYHVMEWVRVKTNSPKAATRLFLFFFSIVLTIFWLLNQSTETPYWMVALPIPIYDYIDCIWLYISRSSWLP